MTAFAHVRCVARREFIGMGVGKIKNKAVGVSLALTGIGMLIGAGFSCRKMMRSNSELIGGASAATSGAGAGGVEPHEGTAETPPKKQKILVVCQYYYPENFQVNDICEGLSADGYDITVLTGLPNYPGGVVLGEYRNGRHRDETINGVRVIRCNEAGRKKGAVHLALNYGTFVASSMAAVNSLDDDFDCVFVYQLSPVMMAFAGIEYAVKHDVPVFLYCCDLWPESVKLYVDDETAPVFKLAAKMSKRVYTACDRIATQSTSFIPYLVETHGLDSKKLVYIPAFADEAYLNEDFSSGGDEANFVFLGNLGRAQNLTAVLEAAKMIRDIPGFTVHFVGDGSCLEEMKTYVKKNGMDDIVVFHGRRPVEEMPKYYKLASACLVSLKADSQIGLTLPSKVQGYMAAGKPIIGMIDGSAQEVIDESRCGVCVPSGDIEGLATAMKSFIQQPEKYKDCGENGREYFKKNFAKAIFMERLEAELDNLRKA